MTCRKGSFMRVSPKEIIFKTFLEFLTEIFKVL